MKEQVARNVVLVRAIETADHENAVLSEDDRMYASRSARELAAWQAADSKMAVHQQHFLEQRADLILRRLAERHSTFAAFLRHRTALAGLWFGLPLLALLAGAALDRIADPHRVDLLSAPLLTIIAWNLLVYLGMLVWAIRSAFTRRQTGKPWLQRLGIGKLAAPRRVPSALAQGVARFMTEWAALCEPLTMARLSRTFHLAAAGFALGAIISLYARGLLTQYLTGWESTFLDAHQVHTLLSWLFAPALAVLPWLQGFTLAEIEQLRFVARASSGDGERWVHLYGATVLLLVIVPRLVFAAVSGFRAARLKRHFPLDLDEPYFRKLADSIGAGTPAVLRVIPYSYTLDEVRDRSLWAIAASALGQQARVQLLPSMGYGTEPKEALRDIAWQEAQVTVTAVLFSLAATPEKENHGALLDYLSQRAKRGVTVLLDESPLSTQWGESAGSTRSAERQALWRQFCSFHGVAAHVVNLLEPDRHALELGAGVKLEQLR